MVRDQDKVPILQVIAGPNAGRVFKLDREHTLIGRNQDCDIVLEPKSVSVTLTSATLRTQAEVDAYLAALRERLLRHITDGETVII